MVRGEPQKNTAKTIWPFKSLKNWKCESRAFYYVYKDKAEFASEILMSLAESSEVRDVLPRELLEYSVSKV